MNDLLPVEQARQGHARVLARVRGIKREFNELRHEVLFMLEGDKWKLVDHFDKATGIRREYKNAAEYLQLTCGIKQATAYDWMRNALLEDLLAKDGLTQIGDNSAQSLRALNLAADTYEMRKGLYILASNAVQGTPSSGDIQRTIDTLATVMTTGAIEVEEGKQAPFAFDALTGHVALEIKEAMQRHMDYIKNARRPRQTLFRGLLADSGVAVPNSVIGRATNLDRVYVAIWEEMDSE